MFIRDIVRRKTQRETPAHATRTPAQTFQRDMNSLFDEFFRDLDTMPAWPVAGERPAKAFSPAVNISETDKEVTVTAELPGMEDKDVSVDLHDDVLTIRGEKKTETEEKGREWHRVEYSYGSFSRAIPLPSAVEADKAKAKMARGVLTVTLPKRPGEEKRRKAIAITGG